MTATLHNWALISNNSNHYVAPSTKIPYFSIRGEVSGYPDIKKYFNGQVLVTPKIINMAKLNPSRIIATTQTGREFILYNVSPDYVNWCRDNNYLKDLDELLQIVR